MKTNRKETKLYNVIFPIWLLMMFPPMWLIVLPGNFIIDSLVLIISMFVLKIEDKKQWYKKYIAKIVIFGMVSDFIGVVFLLIMMEGFRVGRTGEEPYLTIPALIIAAVFIFIFNNFVTFKKEEKQLRFKLALIFAIVTAPYTFLIPSSWLY